MLQATMKSSLADNYIVMETIYITPAARQAVHTAATIIQQSPVVHFTIPELAEKVMLPEKKLKIAFKHVYGMGVYQYLRALRLEKAKELLLEGRSLKFISKSIGYKSESHLCKTFYQCCGETPNNWRKANK
jgi:AraC-like DNA-binding protein